MCERERKREREEEGLLCNVGLIIGEECYIDNLQLDDELLIIDLQNKPSIHLATRSQLPFATVDITNSCMA